MERVVRASYSSLNCAAASAAAAADGISRMFCFLPLDGDMGVVSPGKTFPGLTSPRRRRACLGCFPSTTTTPPKPSRPPPPSSPRRYPRKSGYLPWPPDPWSVEAAAAAAAKLSTHTHARTHEHASKLSVRTPSTTQHHPSVRSMGLPRRDARFEVLGKCGGDDDSGLRQGVQ